MPSKSTEPRSIAAQLVLLFTLAAALLLSCALGVFYWIVVQHAFAEDNAVLADRSRAVRAELQEPNGIQAITQELGERRESESMAYWLRIFDATSHTIASTPGMDQLLPSNIFPADAESTTGPQKPRDYRTGRKLFSLVTLTDSINGHAYTIQLAQDRSADEQFRRNFRALLIASIAFGILMSAVIAITVTRRALRPLRKMTAAVARITPTHLNERLSPALWPDEIRPLAVAFDQMLDRLEDSFTRLSQFSADLAHELRTPVGNILGEAQVALTRSRSANDYREVIESSVAECERISGIVDNLLFLARAEASDGQVQSTVFDAREAAERIAAYHRTVADDRQITIQCDGQGKILGDPNLFNRALNNLIENAIRFTPDGGEIRISIAETNGNTTVTVHDTGCGIPSEHLSRVFDRFYRVDPSRNSKGAGLGLSLVKSIVALHHGSVDIDSELGRGTAVTLVLPSRSHQT